MRTLLLALLFVFITSFTRAQNEITAVVVFTNETCAGYNNGAIFITSVQGGSGVYLFSIDGGVTFQSDSLFTPLMPGYYSIYIKDANNFAIVSALGPWIISSGISITAAVSTMPSHCGLDDGSAYLTMTGGYEPYTITWEGFPEAGVSLLDVPEGTYHFHISDMLGCSESGNVTITQDTPAIWAESIPDNMNTVACDGKIVVHLTDAYPPYTCFLNGVHVNCVNDTISGVCPGSYHLAVDVSECAMNVAVEVPNGLTDGIISNHYRLYPLPAANILYIESDTGPFHNESAEVYSLQGKRLLAAPLTGNKAEVNLTNLEQGTYIIKLRLKDSSFSRKIIKL